MKLETFILLVKCACLTLIPTITVLGEGIKQYPGATAFGAPKDLVTLVCSAIVAGAGGLLAFLSSSFGKYMTNRENEKANGNGEKHE